LPYNAKMRIAEKKILLFFIVVFLFGLTSLYAQQTVIYGKIIDKDTRQAIPFANVYFAGTSIGATSDIDGNYYLKTLTPGDSLQVSYVGYSRLKKKVETGKQQQLIFELQPDQVTLNEVVIVPDEELMDLLFKWIINHKPENDHLKHDYYQCESYNRIQADVNNVNEEMKNRRVFKHFQFIFDNIDTSDVNGKVYLPMFLTESISGVYFRRDPRSKKEIIKASKVSGLENESIAQYVGSMYQSINIYDNYMYLFEKNFISPIANFGMTYYNYTIVDTLYIDNSLCFKIDFEPKRKQELTFSGSMWIHDTTFAVKGIDMIIAEDANLNFINDFIIKLDYNTIEGEHWMPSKEYVMADVNPIENSKRALGFFVHRTSTFRNFILNEPKDPEFYSNVLNIEDDLKALEMVMIPIGNQLGTKTLVIKRNKSMR